MTIVETSIDSQQVSSQLALKVGNGSYMALGARKALMAQRNSDGGIRVYAALTVSEDWTEASHFNWSDVSETKKNILDR